MKNLMILAGVGVLGYFGYKLVTGSATGAKNMVGPISKAQPVTYKSAGTDVKPQPRVDNTNQPWYGSNMSALTGSGGQYDLSKVASSLGSGSSIIHSLSDIFGKNEELSDEDDTTDAYQWDSEPTYEETDYDFTEPQTFDANDSGMGPMDNTSYDQEVA